MDAKKLLETSLHSLMEKHWRGLTMGLGKSHESGKPDAYCKDAKMLVLKLRTFAQGVEGYVHEINNPLKDSCIGIQFKPRPSKLRSKMCIALSINLVTGIGHVFFRSKAGLLRGNFVHLISEDVRSMDIGGTLENIRAFAEKYPEYAKEAEEIAEAKRTEEIKQRKLAEMAAQSIETIVPQIMAQSGYEWNLERASNGWGRGGISDGYILRVKTKKHKMVEISLSQKNFANKIPEILNVIRQIEQLLEQAPYAVNIANYGPGVRWRKGMDYVK